jgi:hypothetical protein
MAEAIVNSKGQPNFSAYSAGSHPLGTVRPEALRQLEMAHLPTEGLRSRAWDEFSTAWRSKARLCFYGLRQRGERGMPNLARTADDRPLGRSRPSGGSTEPKRKWNGRFARRFLFRAESVDCSVFC